MLTHLRTSIDIPRCETAIKHVNYLAKISPFVELGFPINFDTPEDIKFIKKLSRLIDNKSLSKFKVNMRYTWNKNNDWESEDAIKLVLSIVNLISEIYKQYEVNIGGRNIQVIEIPEWITLKTGSIFGENQWIVCQKSARVARLLDDYTQIWEELGVGDLDSKIMNETKSPDDIYWLIWNLDNYPENWYTVLDLYYFINWNHDYKVFGFVFLDWLCFLEPDNDFLKLKSIYSLIKSFLREMRSLKTIKFCYFQQVYEAIKELDLQGLQQNGVEISLSPFNHAQSYKYKFTITADECIALFAEKEIEAFKFKIKGDIEIKVFTWDFTYIVNNEYLLWVWYYLNQCVIDWEFNESEQKFWFPTFAHKLKGIYKHNLILIPLNRIKHISYQVCFSKKDEVGYDIKNLTNEFDSQIWIPLAKPSSLFCLLSEKTNVYINIEDDIDEFEEWNNINLIDEFEEELKSYISISPSIRSINIDLFEITNENISLFLQILKGWTRLNKLTFIICESDKSISQDIIDTIVEYNKWLSQIDVSINNEGNEFKHFAQISCDKNIFIWNYDE